MRTNGTWSLYEIYCCLCFGGLVALMAGGALMVVWHLYWGMGLVLVGGFTVLVTGVLAHRAEYSAQRYPELGRSFAAWRDRHLVGIGEVARSVFFVSLILILAAAMFAMSNPGAYGQGIGAVVSGLILMVSMSALSSYVDHRTRVVIHAAAIPQILVLERPLPTFGEPGAFDDFEDYLRGQLALALAAVNADPCDGSIGVLGSYLNDLFGDAYAGHDILVQITLPAGWAVPATWQPETDGFRPPVRHAWLRLIARVGNGTVFEVAYQLFGQDITLVRFPLA